MRPADAPTLRLVPDRHTARDTSPSGDGHAETTMREQAIQFVGEPGAGGIAATVDAAEAEGFRARGFAGGLVCGPLTPRAAGRAGTQAQAASLADANVGEAPAATVQFQAPVFHDDKLQIVLAGDGAG